MRHSVRYTAIHEAAHAVAGLVLGFSLERVSIHPGPVGGAHGYTALGQPDAPDSPDADNWHWMACAVTDLAGHAATRLMGHEEPPDRSGSGQDLRNATAALRWLAGPGDMESLLDDAMHSAHELVEAAWPAIEAVADELECARSLSGSEVAAILDKVEMAERY